MKKKEIEKLAELEVALVKGKFSGTIETLFEFKREGFVQGYQKATEWISVNDRLPKNGSQIIAYFDEEIFSCYYCDSFMIEYKHYKENSEIIKPSHWMEEIAPPKHYASSIMLREV